MNWLLLETSSPRERQLNFPAAVKLLMSSGDRGLFGAVEHPGGDENGMDLNERIGLSFKDQSVINNS